jgi:ABC-type dipeptide/oligopeptide/nickel transport system permease subunit
MTEPLLASSGAAAADVPGLALVGQRSARREAWGRFMRHPSAMIGLVTLVALFLIAILGPVLLRNNPSSDYAYQDLINSFAPPSAEHWLGTDYLGRDIFVRLVAGARYTLLIGFAAVAAGLALGVPLGALSGYIGGWFDLIVQRIVDIFLAFPSFLLALALVAALGPGIRNLVIAVALTSFPRFVRLLRASVLSVKQMPYVEAARALGIPSRRILFREVMPNSISPIIVQATLEMGHAILTASGLGFLGLGVKEPAPEWGGMLGASRDFLFSYPNLVTFPGVCIVIVVLALNLVGDGLRDVLDPRLK